MKNEKEVRSPIRERQMQMQIDGVKRGEVMAVTENFELHKEYYDSTVKLSHAQDLGSTRLTIRFHFE